MTGCACERESRVGEGKRGIASHCISEIMASLIHLRRIAARRDAIAAHEFRIGHRIAAIALALVGFRGYRGPVQRATDSLRNVGVHAGQATQVEVALLCEARAMELCVKDLTESEVNALRTYIDQNVTVE